MGGWTWSGLPGRINMVLMMMIVIIIGHLCIRIHHSSSPRPGQGRESFCTFWLGLLVAAEVRLRLGRRCQGTWAFGWLSCSTLGAWAVLLTYLDRDPDCDSIAPSACACIRKESKSSPPISRLVGTSNGFSQSVSRDVERTLNAQNGTPLFALSGPLNPGLGNAWFAQNGTLTSSAQGGGAEGWLLPMIRSSWVEGRGKRIKVPLYLLHRTVPGRSCAAHAQFVVLASSCSANSPKQQLLSFLHPHRLPPACAFSSLLRQDPSHGVEDH